MKRSSHRILHLLLVVALLLTFAAPAFAEGGPTPSKPDISHPQKPNPSEDILFQALLGQVQTTDDGQILLQNVVIKPQIPYLIQFSEEGEIESVTATNDQVSAMQCGGCIHKIDYPHRSHHRRGRVNIVAWSKCNAPGTMHVSVALFRNWRLQNTGSRTRRAPGKVKASAATSCRPGLYYGISLHWGVVGESYAFLLLSPFRRLQCH